jgi:hypothetical protein
MRGSINHELELNHLKTSGSKINPDCIGGVATSQHTAAHLRGRPLFVKDPPLTVSTPAACRALSFACGSWSWQGERGCAGSVPRVGTKEGGAAFRHSRRSTGLLCKGSVRPEEGEGEVEPDTQRLCACAIHSRDRSHMIICRSSPGQPAGHSSDGERRALAKPVLPHRLSG